MAPTTRGRPRWPVLATSPARPIAGIGGSRAAFVVYPDEGPAVVMLTNLVGADSQNVIPKIAALYRPLQDKSVGQ